VTARRQWKMTSAVAGGNGGHQSLTMAVLDNEDGLQWRQRGGGVQWRPQRSKATTVGGTDRRW
jgi:hypothetical protein